MPVTVTPTSPSKPGYTTSEFWLVLAGLAGSGAAYFGNSKLGGSLHDLVVVQGPAVAALYVAGRTWLKGVLAKTSPASSTSTTTATTGASTAPAAPAAPVAQVVRP